MIASLDWLMSSADDAADERACRLTCVVKLALAARTAATTPTSPTTATSSASDAPLNKPWNELTFDEIDASQERLLTSHIARIRRSRARARRASIESASALAELLPAPTLYVLRHAPLMSQLVAHCVASVRARCEISMPLESA
jgi:hypothetical protein